MARTSSTPSSATARAISSIRRRWPCRSIAYGGRVKVAGPQGEREIEADKFFVMPDRNMFGETVLEPNELVTEDRAADVAQHEERDATR